MKAHLILWQFEHPLADEMNKKVAILLSTFNGEKWLPDLLESLVRQDAVEIHLIWRDDDSSDKSLGILEKYKGISHTQCTHINRQIGVAESYMHLLQHGDEHDFFAFCDQDDIWDINKIAVAIDTLKDKNQIPLVYSSKIRILDTKEVWPNFTVVPGAMNSLFENIMIGCTVVMNKEFRDLLLSYKKPKELLHDEWIYLLSSFLGSLIFDPEPHILYRLHDNNATGLPAAMNNTSLKKMIALGRVIRLIKRYEIKKIYLEELGITRKSSELSNIFCILNTPIMQRRLGTVKNVCFRQKFFENLVCKILWRIGLI